MNFIKTVIKNKKLVWQLGKNDFKNRFASTSLGTIWGFLQPFVFMITYVIVFEYIMKTQSSGEYPYVVWFLPGMSMWLFLNDSIMAASSSIRTYSYLVKKVVFPVDVIPLISTVASSFVSIFLFAVAIIVCIIFGYIPNILVLLYIIFAAYCFVIAFTRFTSAKSFLFLLNIEFPHIKIIIVITQNAIVYSPFASNKIFSDINASLKPVTKYVNGIHFIIVAIV